MSALRSFLARTASASFEFAWMASASASSRSLRFRASLNLSLSRIRPNLSTQKTFAPCETSFSETYLFAPWMSEISAITAVTPTIVPSRVRNERSLFARSADSAMRALSRNSKLTPADGEDRLDLAAGLADVALDHAVAQADHALGVRGDVLLVRDDDDRLAVGVDLLE